MASAGNGVVARKLRRALAVPRRIVANAVDFEAASRPPILANSVPKSGTHLLLQVLAALPGIRQWGLFLASQPSFTFKQLPEYRMARKIRRMAAGELSGAHVHWSTAAARALSERGALHFLIFRDPRDVVVSEAHYLAEMNRWHRLHRHFRRVGDLQSRIRLAIEGLPVDSGLVYPDVATRYSRFLPWMQRDDVFTVRYEALAGSEQERVVGDIVQFWAGRVGFEGDRRHLAQSALESIRPEASHTYRSGGSGKWREEMDAETRALFVCYGEELATSLGYEATGE